MLEKRKNMWDKLGDLLTAGVLGMIILGVASWLVLRTFYKNKIEKADLKGKKWYLKYDKVASICVNMILCSVYIGLFGEMLLSHRAKDTDLATIIMVIYTVVPYGVYCAFVTGYRRLAFLGMVIVDILVCYFGFVLLSWV